MFKAEKKSIQFIEKNAYIFLIIISTIIGILFRYTARDFASGDFFYHLSHWYDEIVNAGGFPALKQQVGDYNILYQVIISTFSYTNIKPLYAYKLFSVFFDFCMAAGCGVLTAKLLNNQFSLKYFSISYSAVILLPTVVFNSSFWAQCDSIYTFFIILALLCIRGEKDILAFVFLGISCAFKLQFVFILPFFVILYFCFQRFSIFNFLIIPAVSFITSLPAVFMGRGWKVFFDIYISQTNEYQLMNVNIPNVWSLIPGSMYPYLKNYAILLTIAILLFGFIVFFFHKPALENGDVFLACAAWVVWTCVMFLPSMHERYTYPLEILLLMLVVINFRKYFIPFILCEAVSFMMYALFLFDSFAVETILPILYFSVYGYFTFVLIKDSVKNE